MEPFYMKIFKTRFVIVSFIYDNNRLFSIVFVIIKGEKKVKLRVNSCVASITI